jgi:hypothetical protein
MDFAADVGHRAFSPVLRGNKHKERFGGID